MPMGKGFFNSEVVKAAAVGSWPTVIARLTSIPVDQMDARHHACPSCGGGRKFRVFDDFAESGGTVCSACGKNADGFATLQKFRKCNFTEAVKLVGEFLGLESGEATKSDRPQIAPDKHLEFVSGFPVEMAKAFGLKKKPVTPDALLAVGARYGHYRKRNPVMALPAKAKDGSIVGWTLFHVMGRELPVWTKGDKTPTSWTKVKNTTGSRAGWIGTTIDESTKVIWKVEGPSDLLALVSLGLPPGHAAVCNLFGCSEDPASNPWMLDIFRGRIVYVVHDCDEPGQSGALEVSNGTKSRPGWAPAAANVASETRNVVLPYAIQKSNGRDLRDWINERLTSKATRQDAFMLLHELAKRSDAIKPIAIALKSDESLPLSIEDAEAIDDPHRLARLNLENYGRSMNRSVKYWKETWYAWKNGQYEPMTQDHFEAGLNRFIREEFERAWKIEIDRYRFWKLSPEYDKKEDKGPPKIRKVTHQLTRNVILASKSYCSLRNSQELHAWIDGHDEGHCVTVANGILNITKAITTPSPPESEILLKHTPDWFSTVKLNFGFDPEAQCPNWVQFLNDVFSGDEQSIGVLQRWFGYLLTPDNSLQKILFIIGQPRSGKGTILHVMKSLFGESNIATPKLFELAQQYSMHSLVGKTIAVIADARLSEQADETVITERLLSISGGDPQDISRKYKDALTGYDLKVRFTIFSNLLPRIKDQSGAFVSRCIFLQMPNTYLGREDLGLRDRLLQELPGILNWAIMGRHYLNTERQILQPARANPLLEDMTDIVNPVMNFLNHACEFDPSYRFDTKDLYGHWESWCRDNDIAFPGTIQNFCRKVKSIKHIETKRDRVGHIRHRVFMGLRLKQEYVAEAF